MNEQFTKRIKSFFWRLGIATITFALAWVSKNLEILELPLWLQTLLGAFLLPEITKYWANRQALLNRTFLGRKIFKVR